MAKAKKYLAVLLSSVITLSLIVIPGIFGISAATDNDSILDVSGGQEGFVSFFEDLPLKDANTETLNGATLEAYSLSNNKNNHAFLNASTFTVNDAGTFNSNENSFWFSGWKKKYNDLSQLAQRGYVELWVKASAAVEFEVRLPSEQGKYYTQSVNVQSDKSGSWQKFTLPFSHFQPKNNATDAILSELHGVQIVFAQNNGLTDNATVSFGSMSFFTSNTNDNGYVKVNEGEIVLQNAGLPGYSAQRVDYNKQSNEKFVYSKKLTFAASNVTRGQKFYFTVPSDISDINLGSDGYISFWVKSNTAVSTKYAPINSGWGSTFRDKEYHLKVIGGDSVWKEYRIYKSELSNTDSVYGVQFYVLPENLTEIQNLSIEFSGFAVYSKIDPQNNIYATEKELSKVEAGGGAKENTYLTEVAVNDLNASFSTAYQAAVKNSAFYTNANGASFIYYGCNESYYTNYNISKITKDGYIKTYIKTEKPIKLLFSVWGSNYTSSTEFPVYISGSSEWQEILIPLSRLGATDAGFPRVDNVGTAYNTNTIEYNHVYAFRWRVAKDQTNDFLPVVEDEVYNDSNSVYFAPLEFVRMIHADLDNSRNLDSKDFDLMKTALLGIKEVTVANADANWDGNFDIADLVHLKKLLNEMAPIIVDMSNTHTCGNGNGILVSDKESVLPDGTVINAFRNSTDAAFTALYPSVTLLDSICIAAVNNNADGFAEVVSPTGEVIVQIPVSYLYTRTGVNQSNISSVNAAVKHSGGCSPVTIAHDNKYVYVTTSVLGDFCFYSGDEIEATVNSSTSDLKVVLETDHPGVTDYDAVYTAKAYQNGAEISNPVFSTDFSEIAISGNTVKVPASFKDNTSVDGTKLTVTVGDPNKKVLSKRFQIEPYRETWTQNDNRMKGAIGVVTNAPDGSSDFGRWYSLTVGENFYNLDEKYNYNGSVLYMLVDWNAQLDFSTLLNDDYYLRLWVKTPHAATFTVKIRDKDYVSVAEATVTTDGNTQDWQTIDIPVSELNIKSGTDLTTIRGVTFTPAASAKDFLQVGETFTYGAIDLMRSDKITAYYPLMIRNWKNVVTDDFNDSSLNSDIWKVFYGAGTEQGTGATANYNANAIKVAEGNLEMRVVKEPDGTFSIPRISTSGKYEQTYGLFSAKIKTPKNTTAGVNTAFWLLPSSGSWGKAFIGDMGVNSIGEVDIIETSPYWTKYNAQTAIHTWDKDGNKTKSGNEKSLTNSNITSDEKYVDVACVWTENALYFYYDGELVRKEAIKSNPAEKVYAILSMSIAGYDGKETWLGKFTDADVPNLVSYVDSVSISK